jgi:hypothetical protein
MPHRIRARPVRTLSGLLTSWSRGQAPLPYAAPLIGFDAYPILADADEIGVLPIDDIGSTFLARDVEASAICPNSTDMRDGLMRIMRVGLNDAGYLTSQYGLMCSAGRGAGISITATRFFTDFCTFAKAHTPIWRTRSRETPNSTDHRRPRLADLDRNRTRRQALPGSLRAAARRQPRPACGWRRAAVDRARGRGPDEVIGIKRREFILLLGGGPPASFPDETFQVRNEVVESEEVGRLAVNNVVLFAVGVLQKKSFIDAYKVGPVLQCDYEIKQREGQCIAVS